MKKREYRIAKRIARVLHGIGILLLILAFLFGLLILLIGVSEQHTLRYAQDHYTAVSVIITDLQPSARSEQIVIAVLEPIDENNSGNNPPNGTPPEGDPPEGNPQGGTPHGDDPHRPAQSRLGTTAASTINRGLAEGETLTMYYDPDDTDTRVVDFKTAKPLLSFGGTLCGGATAIGLVLLLFRLMRRSKPKPAAQISDTAH